MCFVLCYVLPKSGAGTSAKNRIVCEKDGASTDFPKQNSAATLGRKGCYIIFFIVVMYAPPCIISGMCRAMTFLHASRWTHAYPHNRR